MHYHWCVCVSGFCWSLKIFRPQLAVFRINLSCHSIYCLFDLSQFAKCEVMLEICLIEITSVILTSALPFSVTWAMARCREFLSEGCEDKCNSQCIEAVRRNNNNLI